MGTRGIQGAKTHHEVWKLQESQDKKKGAYCPGIESKQDVKI
jgi:hypothetical protein